MTRLVLFDIDGTLIASGGAGLRAFASVACATFGQRDGTAHLNFAGRTDTSIVREFFAHCDIAATTDNFTRFFDDYVFWLDHYLGGLSGSVLPGVAEALAGLQRLKEPPIIGLLTGNIRLGAELKLRHYGLWSHFVMGAFGDDHEDRNRLAAIARDRGEICLKRPISSDEILVVGDTPHDIACARAIGARCLAVASGGVPLPALSTHKPTWLVSSLSEVDVATLCCAESGITAAAAPRAIPPAPGAGIRGATQ